MKYELSTRCDIRESRSACGVLHILRSLNKDICRSSFPWGSASQPLGHYRDAAMRYACARLNDT